MTDPGHIGDAKAFDGSFFHVGSDRTCPKTATVSRRRSMNLLNRRGALGAGLLCAVGSSSGSCSEPPVGQGKAGEATGIRPHEARYAGGAKGDGRTDDTAALAAAIEAAVGQDQALYLDGTYAVARLMLPGLGRTLRIVGDPVFVQSRPNIPCIAIADSPLQQSVGCVLRCTVIPHTLSSKLDSANMAVDLTGFSTSDILIKLGEASAFTATTGRFHTVIYADAASPFHYGNHIRLIASAVPAPGYGIRYANRGKGVAANPNINLLSGWFSALDTVSGDILIDVGDTTQTIIAGPTLMEACPGAIGVRAGNFTTLRDIWFERIGIDVAFLPTKDTVPNNCRVERCQFSGDGHRIVVDPDLGAPPTFVECLGDEDVGYMDRHGKPCPRGPTTRSLRQPGPPSIAFTQGGGTLVPDQASVRHRVDHHGRTTYQLRYFVRVIVTGKVTVRLTPSAGYEIEQAVLGIRDDAGGTLPWGLGDDLAGRDYDWSWLRIGTHVLNLRVTLKAVR